MSIHGPSQGKIDDEESISTKLSERDKQFEIIKRNIIHLLKEYNEGISLA